jgi:hypothetical protein
MDVDLSRQLVFLRETKNGALRILPLSAAALKVLCALSQGAATDPVFAGVNASRLSVYTKRLFARMGSRVRASTR